MLDAESDGGAVNSPMGGVMPFIGLFCGDGGVRDDDPVAHIGLKMVMKPVKKANYVNSPGLNNLQLTL